MSDPKILLSSQQIKSRIDDIAKEIASDFRGKPLVLVAVLNGSYIFAGDLSRAIWDAGHRDFEVDFVRISSYGSSKESSKNPKLTCGLETKITDKEVVIVEDIAETGYTLEFLLKTLKKQNPKSIRICTLLSKPSREVDIKIDYLGFEVKIDDWVEGYGLDTDFKGRGRADIIKR